MPGDAPGPAIVEQRIVKESSIRGSMRQHSATRALDIFVPQVTAHRPQERLNVPVTVDIPKPREKHRLRRGLRQRHHRCLPGQHRRLIGQLRRIFQLSGQLGALGAHGSHSGQWKYLPICHGREQPVRWRAAQCLLASNGSTSSCSQTASGIAISGGHVHLGALRGSYVVEVCNYNSDASISARAPAAASAIPHSSRSMTAMFTSSTRALTRSASARWVQTGPSRRARPPHCRREPMMRSQWSSTDPRRTSMIRKQQLQHLAATGDPLKVWPALMRPEDHDPRLRRRRD
jgi:hypothetical protein